MKFNEHGEYQVECDGDIIFYRIKGVWNEEASVACIKKINVFIEHRKQLNNSNPIIMIVDTKHFEGALMEAFVCWVGAVKVWFRGNVTHLIRIDSPSSTYYQMFLAPIDEVLKKTATLEFVDDLNCALLRARQLGFSGFEHQL